MAPMVVRELVHLLDVPSIAAAVPQVAHVRGLAVELGRLGVPRCRRRCREEVVRHGDARGEEERGRVVGGLGAVAGARREELVPREGGAVQVEHEPRHHRHRDAARGGGEAAAEEGLRAGGAEGFAEEKRTSVRRRFGFCKGPGSPGGTDD